MFIKFQWNSRRICFIRSWIRPSSHMLGSRLSSWKFTRCRRFTFWSLKSWQLREYWSDNWTW